tara:strand:- start:90 stop:881 length:792 start_codon:yes stop_codon:yes gene_type:complete
MAEYIYIAESPQYPGMVKIGRTDRTVEERLSELSQEDYGLPGSNVDSEWEAVKIIEVQDNEHAEAVLHDHFSDLRVDGSRELFYTDDPLSLSYEAANIVDGTIMTADLIEIGNLFDPLSLVALGAAITLVARTFAPENTSTKKAEKFMKEWELRTEARYKNSNTKIGKFIFGGYKTIFKVNTTIVKKTTGFIEGSAVLIGEVLNSVGIKNRILKRLVDRKIKEEREERAKNPPILHKPMESKNNESITNEKKGWRRIEPTWRK